MVSKALVAVLIGGAAVVGAAVIVTQAAGPPKTNPTVIFRVTDATGAPVAGAIIGGSFQGTTDASGQATFTAPSPTGGAYTYTVSKTGYNTATGSFTLAAGQTLSLPVVISTSGGGGVAAHLAISTTASSFVAGTPFNVTLLVTDSAGNPVSGYSGVQLKVDGIAGATNFPVSDATGQAVLQATISTVGTHSLQAKSAALASNILTITITQVAGTATITFSASPLSGPAPLIVAFSGRYTDAAGNPIAGKVLNIFVGGKQATGSFVTDSTGSFSGTKVIADIGTFSLYVEDLAAGVISNTVTLTVTVPATVSLVLSAPATVTHGVPFTATLTVTDPVSGLPIQNYSGVTLNVNGTAFRFFPATNQFGKATISVTVATAGTYTLQATTASGLTSNLLTITAS